MGGGESGGDCGGESGVLIVRGLVAAVEGWVSGMLLVVVVFATLGISTVEVEVVVGIGSVVEGGSAVEGASVVGSSSVDSDCFGWVSSGRCLRCLWALLLFLPFWVGVAVASCEVEGGS